MSKQPPPAPSASTIGPCPTIIQISRTPRHWKFTQHLHTTRPPSYQEILRWLLVTTLAEAILTFLLPRREFLWKRPYFGNTTLSRTANTKSQKLFSMVKTRNEATPYTLVSTVQTLVRLCFWRKEVCYESTAFAQTFLLFFWSNPAGVCVFAKPWLSQCSPFSRYDYGNKIKMKDCIAIASF